MLPLSKVTEYKCYVKVINHFLRDGKEQTIKIAIEECVDIVQKLIMFMAYRGDKTMQEGTANSLRAICSKS